VPLARTPSPLRTCWPQRSQLQPRARTGPGSCELFTSSSARARTPRSRIALATHPQTLLPQRPSHRRCDPGRRALPSPPPTSRGSPRSARSLPTIACHVAAFIGSPESLAQPGLRGWAAWDLAALCGLGWPRGAAGTELLSECGAPLACEGSRGLPDMRAEPEAPAADFQGASEQALREALGLPEAAVARTLSAAPSDLSWGGRRASPGLPRSPEARARLGLRALVADRKLLCGSCGQRGMFATC